MLKKKWFYIVLSVIIILIVLIYNAAKPKPPEYETFVVSRGNLRQEINITGAVKPAEEVSLSFEKSGKITNLTVKIGDEVKAGKILAEISNLDLLAQLKQAQATLENAQSQLKQYQAAADSQKAKLDEYLAGTRIEEIISARTAVSNAEKTLIDANANLQNVSSKAEADLNQIYNNTLNTLAYSVTIAENALYAITDVQSNLSGIANESSIIIDRKAESVFLLLGEPNAGSYNKYALSQMKNGAKGAVILAQNNSSNENINEALTKVKAALYSIKNTLTAIPLSINMSSSDISSLNTQKGLIDTEISNVIAKEQAIFVQKSYNQNAIDTAKAAKTTAENSVNVAKDQLNLKLAGYTAQQIASQEALYKQSLASAEAQKAMVKSAEAGILNIQAQLGKTYLKAPMNGQITLLEAKLGEIITANKTIAKIISKNNYQIEANVPEVDIANIKINDPATITLDAYSSDQKFLAKVIKIDPAETMIDNVPTYKITLEFNENNDLIRPGMTADTDILTAEINAVLFIPQRAILRKNNERLVRILKNDQTIEEKIIQVGLKSSDGNIEIKSGLNENDLIIVSTKTK